MIDSDTITRIDVEPAKMDKRITRKSEQNKRYSVKGIFPVKEINSMHLRKGLLMYVNVYSTV